MARMGGEWETWISVQRPWSLLGAGHGCQQSHTHRWPFTQGVRWPHHHHSRSSDSLLERPREGGGPFCPLPQRGWLISAQAPPIAHHCGAVRQKGLAGRQIGGAAGGPREGPQQIRCGRKRWQLGPGPGERISDAGHVPGPGQLLESGVGTLEGAGTKLLAGTVESGGTWGGGGSFHKARKSHTPSQRSSLWTETRTAVPVRGSHARPNGRVQRTFDGGLGGS